MPSPTVLYVEDEKDDILFMRLAFERARLTPELEAVTDGKAAIAYLAARLNRKAADGSELPCLILLDLNLPLVSGFDVLTWLRAEPRYKAVPVIVVSSSGRLEDQEKARALGANEYVQKPGSGMQFLDIVRDLARRWPVLSVARKPE